MEIKGQEWEGVLTVEAAMVVPAVIGCLLFLIFMAFSLHDFAVMRAAAAESVISGFAPEEHNGPALLYYREYRWDRQEEMTGLPVCPARQYRICYKVADNDLMSRILAALTGGNGTEEKASPQGEASYIRCNPERLIWMCQLFMQDTEEQAKEQTKEQTETNPPKETLKNQDGR